MTLPDVQKTKPKVQSFIERVGVEKVRFPISVKMKDGKLFNTIATIDAYSSLSEHVKGTNMSRFTEHFNEMGVVCQTNIKSLLKKLRKRLEFDDVYMKIKFSYPIKVLSPVTKKETYEVEDISFIGLLNGKEFTFVMELNVLLSTLCPCSKEISKYNAHNQRALLRVQIIPTDFIWLEDLIVMLREQGSTPIFSLLKRPDEKWVTEHMYDNPLFVEDVVRHTGDLLKKLPIKWFRIKVTSYESIHAHNAVAYMCQKKKGKKWINDFKSFY